MIRDHKPDFMLIQETKMKKDLLGRISFSNSMDGEATNSKGVSGGLTLYNNKHFLVTTIYNEGNSLLCKVLHINNKDS